VKICERTTHQPHFI